MDTSGFCEVGKHGTISLLKRQDPKTVVTAFGIDSDEVTFGRDPSCSVRLFYPDVSLIHCKVVFEDRKAFLVVLGASGLTVDGCQVYPNASTPSTIPLSNNSEFEIREKRFRFTYPSKELRAKLWSTPSRADRRAPRLSMIQSAQVFSPKPSNDPRENLRILKSPLKNTFKSPVKREFSTPSRNRIFAPSSSPLKALAHVQEAEEEEEEEEDDIILVESNHPRVVEEEADLVILEDVVPQAPTSRSRSTTPVAAPPPQAPPPQQVPQTPRRRTPSLHRAVLIRSAHRAVIRAETEEREREEEEEEMEVLESVASPLADASDDEDDDAEEDIPLPSLEPVSNAPPDHSDEEMDLDDEEEKESTPIPKPNWRKSLGQLWPFGSSSPGKENARAQDGLESDSEDEHRAEDKQESPEEAEEEEEGEGEDEDEEDREGEGEGMEEEEQQRPEDIDIKSEDEDEIQDMPAPLSSNPFSHTPVRRPLGSFMTPQVKPRTTVAAGTSNLFSRLGVEDGQTRRSMDPQRMTPRRSEAVVAPKTEQLWRVRDLLQAPEAPPQKTPFARLAEQPLSRHEATASPSRSTRRVIDEAERQAIRERRRSALRELDSPFGGAVPGMGPGIRSPMKIATSTGSSSSSSSTSSMSTTSASPAKSPSKLFRLVDLSPQLEEPQAEQEHDDQEDTRSLLDKMMETVEDMKRRRSMVGATPARTPSQGLLPRMSLGLDSQPPLSPSKGSRSTSAPQEGDEDEDDKENQASSMEVDENVQAPPATHRATPGTKNAPRFSLLRSDVIPDIRAQDDEYHQMDVDEPAEVAAQEESEDESPMTLPKENAPEVQEESETEDAEEQEPEKLPSPVKVPLPSRSRLRVAESPVEAQVEPAPVRRSRRTPSVEPEEHPAPIVPRRGRSRSATVEPEEQPAAATVSKLREPAKRARKPTVSSIEEAEQEPEEDEAPPAPAKASSRKKAFAGDDVHKDVPPAPKTASKAGRLPKPSSRIATSTMRAVRSSEKAKASEAVEENDELDMIDEEVQDAKPTRGRKKVSKEETEAKVAPNPPPTRIARAKSTTSLKSAAAKAAPAAIAATRSTAATKTTTTTTTKTPATRIRTTRKTPATAPAATTQSGDKENTPGPDESGPVNDEPVKARVSKTTRKVASGTSIPTRTAKKELVEAEAAPAKGRIMRSTRARTKA